MTIIGKKNIPLTNWQLGRLVQIAENKYPGATQTWGAQPIIFTKSSGGKPLLLYFTAEYSSYNQYPPGQGIYVSSHPFRFFILLNEGNADIMFDFNYKPENMRYSCLLRAQEDFQIEAKGDERIWGFGCYAVTAGGPAPSVNATNWNSDPITAHLRMIGIV